MYKKIYHFCRNKKIAKSTNRLIGVKTHFSKKNILRKYFLFNTETSENISEVAILTAEHFSTAKIFNLFLFLFLKFLWLFE